MITPRNTVTPRLLKAVLFLIAAAFALAAAVLVLLWASAATGTGAAPSTAVTLAEGVNTGLIPPGQQRWFRFKPDEQQREIRLEKSLTLIFTPDDGNRIRHVKMQLFEGNQLRYFNPDDTTQMTNFGAATAVSRDKNPETGEFFWNGWLFGSDTYYVQILNDSDMTIDYWLFTDNVFDFAIGEPEPAAVVPAPDPGTDPTNPAPLMPGTSRGAVDPHSTNWYAFTYVDTNDRDRFQDRDFTMFFTPDDGSRRHHVSFEIFPLSELAIWQRGDRDKLTNLGAGTLVKRDDDPNTGELTWRGSVVKGDTYLLAVRNGTEVEIDYWLYDDDIYNPQLGPQPTPEPPPVYAEGAAPSTAFPLEPGPNKGGLDPGQQAWYSFRLTDFDQEDFEEMALTMVTTPDDGNRIQHMAFEVFTADAVQHWSPNDNSRIRNLGAGGIVVRDENLLTGERLWKGWIVDNELYYVQIRNGTDVHMDYWLFIGDLYRPQLDGMEP